MDDAVEQDSIPRGLSQVAQMVQGCTRCDLYRHATQAVPGEGPRRAPLMLVGEQPGNEEDLAGHPFIGPAGRMLDRALVQAAIPRAEVFVTNAVKHFKFEPRGKRRLHKRPDAHEIERCRWWLDNERRLVKPVLTVALGATAARSLLGKAVTISRLRGKVQTGPETGGYAGPVLVTVHPSFLLRMPDADRKETEFAAMVRDLTLAREFALPR